MVAAGIGAVGAAVLPTTRLPLAVGGYVTGFLLVTALLLAVGRRLPGLSTAKSAPARPMRDLASRRHGSSSQRWR
ncbi:hypothetical protein GCM10027614_64030 [Micromonospora vulcania]